jgi:hypothetical protein
MRKKPKKARIRFGTVYASAPLALLRRAYTINFPCKRSSQTPERKDRPSKSGRQ